MTQIREIFKTVHFEMNEVSGHFWEQQMDQSHGSVNLHILKVMFCLVSDPDYMKVDRAAQNTLLWGCLFHDIGRRTAPSSKISNRQSSAPSTERIRFTLSRVERCSSRLHTGCK